MFASRASATSSSTWRHAARVVSDDVGALAAQFGFKLRAGEHATPRAVASRVRAPDAALDARVTLIYAIIMFAFNWLLRRAVVEPLAGRLMGYGARGVGGARKARRRKMEKFAQSALEMVTYGTFTDHRVRDSASTAMVLAVERVVDRGTGEDAGDGERAAGVLSGVRGAIRRGGGQRVSRT